jgi:hypothetical protein
MQENHERAVGKREEGRLGWGLLKFTNIMHAQRTA